MQRLKPIPKWGVLTQIYELKCRIHGTTRGEWSIAAYVHRLRALWQELDHYHNFQIACAIDAMKIQKMVEEGRIYEFLAGLNVEYDKIRVKIEESCGGAMLHSSSQDWSTLATASKWGF